jgi:hypothetical protein
MQAKVKLFAKAGVASYWVVDPTFDGGVVLTEFGIGEDGYYETVASTNKVFTTEAQYPITIDVPALTELRAEFRRAQSEG